MGRHTLIVPKAKANVAQRAVGVTSVAIAATGMTVSIEDTQELAYVEPPTMPPFPPPPPHPATNPMIQALTQFKPSIPPVPQALLTPPPPPPPPTRSLPAVKVKTLPLPVVATKPRPLAVAVPKAIVAPKSALVDVAKSWLGKKIPYLFGGGTLRGMDCSHLVWEIMKQAGYHVPYRNSAALKAWTTPIPRGQERPGDLVFWPGHVGIYAGGGMVIDHGSGIGPKFRKLWPGYSFGRIP